MKPNSPTNLYGVEQFDNKEEVPPSPMRVPLHRFVPRFRGRFETAPLAGPFEKLTALLKSSSTYEESSGSLGFTIPEVIFVHTYPPLPITRAR